MRVWACLLALLLPCAPSGAQVETYSNTLSWEAPTHNTDDTPLTDLDGYRIYHGCTASGQYERPVIDIPDPSVLSHTVNGLEGTCYFVATAYNVDGVESDFSGEAVSVQPVTNPPGVPVVQIQWRARGEAMPLVNTGLVARYYFDEAASGTAPTAVVDHSGNGFDLDDVNYSTTLAYTELGGQRGLEATDTGGSHYARRVLADGTDPMHAELDGGQQFTFEIVVRGDAFTASNNRVIVVNEQNTSNPEIGIAGTSTSNWNFSWNESLFSMGNLGTAKQVIHVVVDSALDGTAGNERIKVYQNGTLFTVGNAPVGLNDTLVLGAPVDWIAFNRGNPPAARSMDGVLFYAAVYTHAFTATEVANNEDILALDDDQPPTGTPVSNISQSSIEALASESAARTSTLESLSTVVASRSPVAEAISGVIASRPISFEAWNANMSTLEIAAARSCSHETLRAAASLRGADIEAKVSLLQPHMASVESLVSTSMARAAPLEALSRTERGALAPFEALGEGAAAKSAVLPIEALASRRVSASVSLEALRRLDPALARSALEALVGVRADQVLDAEAVAEVATVAPSDFEALRGVSADYEAAIEALASASLLSTAAVEALSSAGALASVAVIPVESLVALSGPHKQPIEALSAQVSAANLTVEATATVTASSAAALESLIGITVPVTIPQEARGQLARAVGLDIEARGFVIVRNVAEREVTFQLLLRRDVLFTATSLRDATFARTVKRDVEF